MKKLIFILLLFIVLASMAVSAAERKTSSLRERPVPGGLDRIAGADPQCLQTDIEKPFACSRCRAFTAGKKA